jgi:hypothetical protein
VGGKEGEIDRDRDRERDTRWGIVIADVPDWTEKTVN